MTEQYKYKDMTLGVSKNTNQWRTKMLEFKREIDNYGDPKLVILWPDDEEGDYQIAQVIFNQPGEWYAIVGYSKVDLKGPIMPTALKALKAAWQAWDDSERYFTKLNQQLETGQAEIHTNEDGSGGWRVKPTH